MEYGRTVIVGLGVTGISCLRHLCSGDNKGDVQGRITVVDSRPNPPMLEEALATFANVEFLCGKPAGDVFARADRAVVSPGIPLNACMLAEARESGTPLISDISLFCEAVNVPVIAVSGTNGKSTVTALTGALLRGENMKVGVGGNLGDAALDIIRPENQAYVLELSSFQLERLITEHFHTAGLLNISSDHMDRYSSFERYAAAKQRIFLGCNTAIFNRDDLATRPVTPVTNCVSVGLDQPAAGEWGILTKGKRRYLSFAGEALINTSDLPIQGKHNELNALMALALASSLVPEFMNCSNTLRQFHGLPHRCELVSNVAGVRYVDDSKATNVGASVAALEGLGEPGRPNVVLIAGGDSKQSDLEPLRSHLDRYVHDLVLLGKDADRIAALVLDQSHVHRVDNMEQAVRVANTLADSGDLVLLSPACSSLDMFTSFEARGRSFSYAVARLDSHD